MEGGRQMNVLVTGGAGFIGSHLVEELVKRGDEVTILDNLSTGKEENLAHIPEDKFVCWVGDICSEKQFPHDLEYDFDVVYHLAAKRSVPLSFKYPHAFFKDNISGTYNMLEKNKGARIVNISSSSAEQCLSPYAISKKTAEMLAAIFPNTVSLRLFNVFGERQADCGAIMPEFTKLMLKGKQPTVYGDGLQTRDFTYVKDVVRHLIKYGQGNNKELTGVFDVGYGVCHTVNDIYDKIAKYVGVCPTPIFGDRRAGDIRYSKAENTISSPKYGLNKGLKRTVEWIKKNPYGGK